MARIGIAQPLAPDREAMYEPTLRALPSLLLFCAAALMSPGCGGHGEDAARASASFHRIQVAEAQLWLGAERAADPSATPAERAEGARLTCEAAEALCDEADGLDDPDATIRCERAEQRCASAKAQR